MGIIHVDGREIEAPEGAPLVEVLKNNGVYVSSLCYLDGLKPYAGCRSCLVDIEGPPGLQLSCTSVVENGMTVRTTTDEVKEARRAVMSLILANHSDRCLTCHRREHCHPGDICLRDDVVTHRCLTCSKNYRCELQVTCEAVGMSEVEPWIGEERSWYQHPQPLADRENPFMEFDPQMCIICTRCQRACDEKRHTGAISLSGKGWNAGISFGAGGAIHESNCDFSGACIDVCPTAALMEHPNKWVAKPEVWTTTTCNSCAIGCSIKIGSAEGRGLIVRPGDGNPFSGDQICVRGRYHYDSLKPREKLSRHLVRRGQVLTPAGADAALTEAARTLREAAEKGTVGVLVGGTATNEEARLAAALAEVLGGKVDSSGGPVARAVRSALTERLGAWKVSAPLGSIPAAKTIVLVHDDLEESHNVASVRIKDAVVRNGATLIVIGALRSELVDFATLWVRPGPGGEGKAAAEVAQAIENESAALGPAATDAAAILRASTGEILVVCAPNPLVPELAGSMTGGAANIAIALHGDAASEHLVVLPADVNSNGLADMGVGTDEDELSLAGLSALLTVRDDPTMRGPAAAAAVASIPTVIAIDSVLSQVAKGAGVVLAEGGAYSATGTYTLADFRIQRLAKAVMPEGDALPLYEVLSRLAGELGVEPPSSPDLALEHIARERPVYWGAADLIIGEGVRLNVSGSGQGTAVPVAAIVPAGPLSVIASRDLYTAADAAALRHPEADKLHRYDRIQVSEAVASARGLATGDRARMSSGGASIEAPITVCDRVPDSAIYVSALLQGGAVAPFYASSSVPAVQLEAVTGSSNGGDSPAATDSDFEDDGGGPLAEAAGGP